MKLLTASLLAVILIAACSRSASNRLDSSVGNYNAGGNQSAEPQNRELQNEIEQIALAAKGRVGVAAVVLDTGETVSLNPHDHFPMQSVYKLPIGMAVMKQVDAGKIKLDQKVRVTKSDFIASPSRSPIRDKN